MDANQIVLSTKSPVVSGSSASTFLVFQVGQETYGLPVDSVIRIIEMVTITHLPGLAETIQGIINLRGRPVPILDLRRRFGLPPVGYGLHTPIILVDPGNRGQALGLVVDTVEDVLHVPAEDLELTETMLPAELMESMNARSAYLAGIAKINRRIILLLNVSALLSPVDQGRLAHILNQ